MLNQFSLNSAQEHQPESSLPHVWVGFLFALAFLVAEFVEVFTGNEEATVTIPTLLIGIGGWVYWLFCVYRMHKVLEELTGGGYPI